jgi:hypothetical protein
MGLFGVASSSDRKIFARIRAVAALRNDGIDLCGDCLLDVLVCNRAHAFLPGLTSRRSEVGSVYGIARHGFLLSGRPLGNLGRRRHVLDL